MPLTCPKCGAENRESAKFCLKCAQQLVPLGPSAPPQPRAKKRRRRRQTTAAATDVAPAPASAPAPAAAASGLRWALMVAAFATAVVAAWALMRPPAARTADAPSAGATQPAAPSPRTAAPTIAASTSILVPAPQTPVAPLPGQPAPRVSVPASSASAPVQAAAPAAATRPVTVQAAGVDTTAAVAKRPERHPARSDKTTRAPRQALASPPSAVVAPPEPIEAPAPRPPAPAVVAAPSGALCAERRFIGYAMCLQAECTKPGMRQHPQCVRMREQQDAVRVGSGEN